MLPKCTWKNTDRNNGFQIFSEENVDENTGPGRSSNPATTTLRPSQV